MNSYSPVPKSKSLALGVIFWVPLLFSNCELFESDVNKETHITQITVSLTGELSDSETATISIDGIVAGVASMGNPVAKEVDAGPHTLSFLDSRNEAAWGGSQNIVVEDKQTFNYNLVCGWVRINLKANNNCQEPGKVAFPITLELRNAGSTTFTPGRGLYEGDREATVQIDHGEFSIVAIDKKGKIFWEAPITYYQFNTTLTVTIDCP